MYYENCYNGTLINNFNVSSCNYCDLEKCSSCPNIALNKDLCMECNTSYYEMENDTSNYYEYINCYKEPKGYYLDEDSLKYKKCYYTCDTCGIKGNNVTHNCFLCNKNFPVKINYGNYCNCYENCSYYYYFDDENIYHCTINESCPEEYKLLKNTMECVKYDIKESTEEITREEKIKYYDKILENVESIFTSKYYNTSILESGQDQILIDNEKIKVTLTTTQNQINNINDNMTSIYLGHCETLLRNFYNISNDKLLYIKKIDVVQEGMKIPKVEFDIYCKLNGTNLIKLNLSVCKNTEVSLGVPVIITEDLNKLNASGAYYNDKCYKAKSDSGTDILIKDRQKEFVEGNKTVCQDDCNFYEYDDKAQKANCSCKVKESSSSIANMTINTSKLYENFADTSNKKEISNLGVTSCNVFKSTDNIKSNTGFFLLLIILAIFIIMFIIFCSRGYNLLENKIDKVVNKKFKNENKHKISNNKIH